MLTLISAQTHNSSARCVGASIYNVADTKDNVGALSGAFVAEASAKAIETTTGLTQTIINIRM